MASKSNRKLSKSVKDLTGRVFGKLVVIRVGGRWPMKWQCQCGCGKEVVVRGSNLISGNTRSCGCLSKDNRKGIPHPEARERANPCTKRDDGYMLSSAEWARPFIADESTSDEDVAIMSAMDDLSKGRIVAMMYKAGNSPEHTAASFGWSTLQLDEWIGSKDQAFWDLALLRRKLDWDKRKNQIAVREAKDPSIKLRKAVSGGAWRVLRARKPSGIFKLLPYTLDDLVHHLESQFRPGMTWANYGRKWHLDHKKPVSWFDWSVPDAIAVLRECWALSNLQPLWKTENLSKGNKFAHA